MSKYSCLHIIFAAVKNYKETFQAAILILLFLKLSKLNQNTYNNSSEKPLFSHEVSF
jgi:hypothetical protein